jgi:hypothetical protein
MPPWRCGCGAAAGREAAAWHQRHDLTHDAGCFKLLSQLGCEGQDLLLRDAQPQRLDHCMHVWQPRVNLWCVFVQLQQHLNGTLQLQRCNATTCRHRASYCCCSVRPLAGCSGSCRPDWVPRLLPEQALPIDLPQALGPDNRSPPEVQCASAARCPHVRSCIPLWSSEPCLSSSWPS